MFQVRKYPLAMTQKPIFIFCFETLYINCLVLFPESFVYLQKEMFKFISTLIIIDIFILFNILEYKIEILRNIHFKIYKYLF